MSRVYDEARKFAEKFVAPHSKELDKTGEFPKEIFKQLGEHGYFKLIIPKELGGLGYGAKEHAEVIRALAVSSATVGLTYMMHNVALNVILNKANEELKKEILTNVLEKNEFLALAYSESGSGTHFYLPETTAVYDGNGGVTINGRKSMVTSALNASYYLVLTSSKKEGEIDNWVIRLGTEGLSFIPEYWDGLGMRANVSCPMDMKNVKLEDKYRTGEAGSAMEQVLTLVAPLFILGLASVYTGLNQAILDEAVAHSMNRKYPDGKTLSQIDTVKNHLARVYSMAYASLKTNEDASIAAAEGHADALAKILASRILASENVVESARLMMRVGGGKAYNMYGNFERYLRDAMCAQIMAPSVDVLIQWLGQAITGQQIP